MQDRNCLIIYITSHVAISLFIYMKTVTIVCEECRKSFDKLPYNVKRIDRRGGHHFCSHSCRTHYFNKHLTKTQTNIRNERIDKYRYIRRDEYSPFRIFAKRVRQADIIKRYGISDIDLEYLKELWENQHGKCAYTGIQMILPKTLSEYHKLHSIKKISLDRIDSSNGYIKGNVHFVCQAINLAKRDLPHLDMIHFIEEIKNAEKDSSALKEIGGPAGSCIPVSKNEGT